MSARAVSACDCRGKFSELVAGSVLIGHPGDEYTCTHDHVCGDECLSFFLDPELVEAIGDGPAAWQIGSAPPLAGIDGAGRTGAGGGRWQQRHRPRRDRPGAGEPLCRGGFRQAAQGRPRCRPRPPPRGGNRAVDRRQFAPATSTSRTPLRRPASARSISCGCSRACSASPRTNIWCARGCAMRRGGWPTTTARSPISPMMSASATSPISSAPSIAPPAPRRCGSARPREATRKIFQERLALH